MKLPKSNFIKIIQILVHHSVEFIVVGGISAILHGAPVTTFDLDVMHNRSPQNIQKLLEALQEMGAFYRVRDDIKITPDIEKLASPGHHLLMTNWGELDILGRIGNSKEYADVIETAEIFEVAGTEFYVQSLESLIEVKKIMGRNKDKFVIPILQRTLEERK